MDDSYLWVIFIKSKRGLFRKEEIGPQLASANGQLWLVVAVTERCAQGVAETLSHDPLDSILKFEKSSIFGLCSGLRTNGVVGLSVFFPNSSSPGDYTCKFVPFPPHTLESTNEESVRWFNEVLKLETTNGE
jgi:hypothetical protein